MRTPSAKSMIGMHASTSNFNPWNKGAGAPIHTPAKITPAIIASIIGLASKRQGDALLAPSTRSPLRIKAMPTEK